MPRSHDITGMAASNVAAILPGRFFGGRVESSNADLREIGAGRADALWVIKRNTKSVEAALVITQLVPLYSATLPFDQS